MKPKKIWANLTVASLKRTIDFYTDLGFTPNGEYSVTGELTSFTVGDDGFIINFFLKEKLETNTNLHISKADGTNEVLFSLSADNREEADRWAEQAEKAGAQMISKPEEFGDGYYGFVFADPDGHAYNVLVM